MPLDTFDADMMDARRRESLRFIRDRYAEEEEEARGLRELVWRTMPWWGSMWLVAIGGIAWLLR